MKNVLLSLAAGLIVTLSPPVFSETDGLDDARNIIADLGRIVAPNGVQETFVAKIGGIDQWMNVRGHDRDNPLLLFLHGGPATPDMPVAWTFQRPWEEYFTVVQWDQRGAGKTYRANDPEKVAPTITIDRFVEDTVEVIELLRKRYGKRKVVLVGHSWGTIIGLMAALEKPEWIHAYVGIGQVISVPENERIGYAHALRKAREEGNERAVCELESIAPYPGKQPLTVERIGMQRKWVQYYWGLSAYRHESGYYFNAPKLSPEYDAEDRAAIDKGSMFTVSRIVQEWVGVDFQPVNKVSFPVIMFMGRHDYTTPSELTADWLDNLDAPVKHGVWFEHSAHLEPMEEPGKTFLSLVNLVLPLTR